MTQLQEYFRSRNLFCARFAGTPLRRKPEEDACFSPARCDAMAAMHPSCEAVIAKAPQPDYFAILPQQITKEPLAPVSCATTMRVLGCGALDDLRTHQREELGITKANVDQMRMSDNLEIRRFFAARPPVSRVSAAPGRMTRQERRQLRRDLRPPSRAQVSPSLPAA